MRVLLILAMLAGVGFAKDHCKMDPTLPFCPVIDADVVSSEVYCAVFHRGLYANVNDKDTSRTGEFIQLFPIALCDRSAQSKEVQDVFLFKAILGSAYLTFGLKDSAGVKIKQPFEMGLTKAEKVTLSDVKEPKDLAKSVSYKVKVMKTKEIKLEAIK